MSNPDRIDTNNLTERELLLKLNYEVDGLRKDFSDLKTDVRSITSEHLELRDRVTRIETRHKTFSAIYGMIAVGISIIISFYKK